MQIKSNLGPGPLELIDIASLPSDSPEALLFKRTILKQWLAAKQVGHAWQMKGVIHIIEGWQVDLEGIAAFDFKTTIRDSLKIFSENNGHLLNAEEFAHLSSLLTQREKMLWEQDADLLHTAFQTGSPISVFTGFNEHRVVVSFDGDYLFIANKGASTRRPLEVYQIDRERIDTEALQKLIDLNNQENGEYDKWLRTLPQNYRAVKNPLCLCIEQAYPLSSYQEVGNCAWESLQTNIYGVLLFLRLQEHFDTLTPTEKKERIDTTNQTFEEWRQFLQMESLDEFFSLCTQAKLPSSDEETQSLSLESVDPSFLHALFVQYWSTHIRRETFKQQMDLLEAHYFQTLDPMTCAARKVEKLFYSQWSRVPYLTQDLVKVWTPPIGATLLRAAYSYAWTFFSSRDNKANSIGEILSKNLDLVLLSAYSTYRTGQLLRRNLAI